jgi:catechol 2,3-dioxygenase-like lactoylglutathione lyase family enzyme
MPLLAGLALALANPAAGFGVEPWTEAVVSVRDPAQASRLLREVGGWRITHRGALSRRELDYWRLPVSATGTFLRLCAARANTGCIRFVRFGGVPQRPIRLAARPWDTGGIFSLMVRSTDVQRLFDRAIALGWWAESEPIAFRFGSSDLRNVVLQGPDGLQLAAYQRVSPPFTDFPLGLISQAFNSMRMVSDQRASLVFYKDRLGFSAVFNSDYRDPAPQASNFSLPHNLTPTIVRRAAALQPAAGETGRVEVMQFVGLTGKNLSAHASAPNLGILSVRYPVRQLAEYRRQLSTAGVVPVQQAAAVPIGGIGRANLFAVRDPDGNLTEFYEVAQ